MCCAHPFVMVHAVRNSATITGRYQHATRHMPQITASASTQAAESTAPCDGLAGHLNVCGGHP